MDKVTTNEALKILRERGFEVSYPTVARWAQTGAFEGAERDDTHPRGPLWLIPRASVLAFEPPKTGRPPKSSPTPEKAATGAKRASNGGSTTAPQPKANKASGQDGRVIVTKKGRKK